jgi:DNA modification methylase
LTRIGEAKIIEGDARGLKTHKISDNSVDGVVSSPPYSFAIDYLKGDKSQLSFLGINTETLRKRMIGLRGKNASDKVLQYFRDMDRVFGVASSIEGGKVYGSSCRH